jgi:hypothetical protein
VYDDSLSVDVESPDVSVQVNYLNYCPRKQAALLSYEADLITLQPALIPCEASSIPLQPALIL